ncbi:hypothetical protein PV325_006351 [Microctonus aethiopoides]|uniref:CWF19-like protein 1 n=1 Tax=Microctonus aethiopoides TaxID=144406 RepID=A0AA39FQ89_9HYME|nr:hypothetical protein PV325_006351 [Microctonus aethiopoides]KAK0096806.1 hypothetical protein PV326_004356 [Microctonus aethiopoides]KAK0173834.1 hypothetical protein PV328_006977 [Microctonus aethiopoides]
MADKQKILICGDVEGRFKLLFSKVESIIKKSGSFDLLLCVGDFFGENNSELEVYKSGIKKIPLSTFIIGPSKDAYIKHYSNLDGCEICENVTYLGRRGLYSGDSGLKIAYISGIESNDQNLPQQIKLTENDVISLRNSCLKGQPSFRGIDILLSSQWPIDITSNDPNEPKISYNGSKLIAWLAAQIKPRYHISALEGIHYERPPYRNQGKDGDNIQIASRFMALARVGNSSKDKWLYALNLTPVDRTRLMDLATRTTDETPSPYPAWTLNSEPSAGNMKNDNKNVQFFYDMDSNRGKKRPQNDKSFNKNKKMEFDTAKCWFCLSSPDVSKHLVISVGNEAYIALAKGGLVKDHFLILPISHYQSLSTVPESIENEIEQNKKAITRYYADSGRVPVFFERNYKSSHCQLQVVPVPKHLEPALEETFRGIAESQNLELISLRSPLKKVAPPGTTYFYIQLPNGDCLYHKIGKHFPLQFGREVLASDDLLNLGDKIDWKDCQKSIDEEIEMAQDIRQQFKPYEIDS